MYRNRGKLRDINEILLHLYLIGIGIVFGKTNTNTVNLSDKNVDNKIVFIILSDEGMNKSNFISITS